MRRSGTALLACLPLLVAGCAYHNVIHNAGRLFESGEEHRRAGRDSLSTARYQDVVRKTGEAFRARPDADWACDALVMLGRAHQRLGDLRAARAALERARTMPGRCTAVDDVQVYLAAVAAELGDRRGAVERLNAALEGELSESAAAEAHLLRGRLLMQRSLVEHGWWDLDRATDLDSGVSTSAGLAALAWGVTEGSVEQSRQALSGLLLRPAAGIRVDSILRLSERARARWGDAEAADLLEGVGDADWDVPTRGRAALHRAELLHAAGDTAAARRQAADIASGLGEVAADARLMLAGWRLARARDLQQLAEVRSVLLPSGSDPRVAAMLAAIEEVGAYANAGLDDPVGLFAAGEIARDRLAADLVARGLMLAYADGPHDEPWKAKALLAVLELTDVPADRAWLRGRLETHRDSPYVLAAHGGSAAGFEALEEELQVRLEGLSRQ